MANLNRFGTRLDAFSRRKFLGGAGVIVGLPMLESLTARTAKAATAGTPRLICVSSGSGVPMDEFGPNGTGTNYSFKTGSGAWGTDTIWRMFGPLKSKTSVFTGLGIDEGAHSPGDHGAGMPASFTCANPSAQYAATNQQDYQDPNPKPAKLGISIDQLMAQKYAGQARLMNGLQLAMSKGAPLGDGPYGPTYLENRSWKSDTVWNPPQYSPSAVFSSIFAGYDSNASAAENARRAVRRMSVLDYVQTEAKSLLAAVSKDDGTRLDQYFTSARELETQLINAQKMGSGSIDVACAKGAAAPADGLDYPGTVKAMADLVKIAFMCDVTRSVMFQLSCYRSDMMYSAFMKDPRVNDNHHSLSHAADTHTADSGWRKVNRWIFDQIAYLATQLDGVMEANGKTILDNSLIVYSNDCGDGSSHDHHNLPIFTVGSAGGNFPAGRAWSFPSDTPAAGLFVTALNALGVDTVKTFGSKASGPLALP